MTVPDEVARAWGWTDAAITQHHGGLINATYMVSREGEPFAVVQRLHPVFGARVNDDIDAVTSHLAARGLVTPRLVRTLDGRTWFDHAGHVWRALTYIRGRSEHRVPSPEWARAGGELVGRFHRAVADLRYAYAFWRAGVHDTPAHLAKLRAHVDARADAEACELGAEILAAAATLPELPATARRHCHGDLKISNLLFETDPIRAVCLVDLDTVGFSTMAFELGDAMRSWCNPHGEDANAIAFDLPIFEAAMAGFRSVADPIVTADERRSIVAGLETVCVELASRFAVDVFRDEYFGWDATRFPSRRAHNLVRSRCQLTLARSVRLVRSDALAIVLA